jgi:hypothetical protein
MNNAILDLSSDVSETFCTTCMDASPLFDPEYFPVIAVTLIGFAGLAAALLVPIWRFLDREEEVAEDWTPEAVAKRLRELRTENVEKEETRTGAPSDAPSSDAPSSDAPSSDAPSSDVPSSDAAASGQGASEAPGSPSH